MEKIGTADSLLVVSIPIYFLIPLWVVLPRQVVLQYDISINMEPAMGIVKTLVLLKDLNERFTNLTTFRLNKII